MEIGTIKEDAPEAHSNEIPEVKKTGTKMERPITHKYNNRSRTKRVNHVVTLKNEPNF